MKILALDFSSPQRSVAVWSDGQLQGEVLDVSPGRDMKPLALVEAALRAAKWEREAVTGIAVGLGPGSYTGIRVAVSLAQGWQLATGVKLLGVSSVAAIAATFAAARAAADFAVVIDAQRGEFYQADYAGDGGVAREVGALRLVTRAELEARAVAGKTIIGPEVTRWFPAGRVVFPQAAMIARLGSVRTDFLSGEQLEPIYLRETTFVKAPPARVLPLAP